MIYYLTTGEHVADYLEGHHIGLGASPSIPPLQLTLCLRSLLGRYNHYLSLDATTMVYYLTIGQHVTDYLEGHHIRLGGSRSIPHFSLLFVYGQTLWRGLAQLCQLMSSPQKP